MRYYGTVIQWQRRDVFIAFSILVSFSLSYSADPTDEADVFGVRIDSNHSLLGYGDYGQIIVNAGEKVIVRLFGQKFDEVETIMVTKSSEECVDFLDPLIPREALEIVNKNTLTFSYIFPIYSESYYFCFNWNSKPSQPAEEVVHQGNKPWQHVRTGLPPPPLPEEIRYYYMPMPLQVIIIVLLLVLSGLFSGLNLGLMSLDKTELQIILKVGEKREREYAEKIYPIRRQGNYLLCSLLLGNVLVNSAISILFDDLTSGLIALAAASLGIVVFGEIVPQAICSRYGLAVGAYTVYLTLFFMVLTAPLSWPISKLLDVVLGEEVGSVYNKERLLELIRMSKDREGELQNCQEVQIVTGALELSKKRVRDVMTSISDIYMLPSETILDPMMVSEIVKSGYTRIPVYDSANRHNIVAMLNVKDLALLDPEDKIPLTTICKFYQHPVRFVMEDTPLNVMLEEFKIGHYHMAIVQRINTEGEGDPIYEVVGLITLEDILEEIIQAEIMDEFDVIRNSRRRPKRAKEILAGVATAKDVTTFFYNPDADVVDVSPQLSLATYQYLSTTFEAFRSDVISDQVLQRLIRQNVIRTKPPDAYESPKYLYQKDKENDYFILILEGRATIIVGESELIFEPGPFHHFGYEVLRTMLIQAPRFSISKSDLTSQAATVPVMPAGDGATTRRFTFTPDFTLKVTHELIYLKITTSTYLKAYRATLIERSGSTDLRKQSASVSVLLSPDACSVTGLCVDERTTNGKCVTASRSEENCDKREEKTGNQGSPTRNSRSSPDLEVEIDMSSLDRTRQASEKLGKQQSPDRGAIKIELCASGDGSYLAKPKKGSVVRM